MRKFYKQIIHVEVLTEDDPLAEMELNEVHHFITEGDGSGKVTWDPPLLLDGPSAAAALVAQGSEPGFFRLNEDGSEA